MMDFGFFKKNYGAAAAKALKSFCVRFEQLRDEEEWHFRIPLAEDDSPVCGTMLHVNEKTGEVKLLRVIMEDVGEELHEQLYPIINLLNFPDWFTLQLDKDNDLCLYSHFHLRSTDKEIKKQLKTICVSCLFKAALCEKIIREKLEQSQLSTQKKFCDDITAVQDVACDIFDN